MDTFNQTRREMGFELNELKNHMECKILQILKIMAQRIFDIIAWVKKMKFLLPYSFPTRD